LTRRMKVTLISTPTASEIEGILAIDNNNRL
jgi:hypothetical protein